jgi:hypothetical protein
MGKRKRQKKAVRRLGAFLGAVVAEAAGNAMSRGLELLSTRLSSTAPEKDKDREKRDRDRDDEGRQAHAAS